MTVNHVRKKIPSSMKIVLVYTLCVLLEFAAVSAYIASAITISSGIYPGAPSYTIFKEGATYYAKDINGQINYRGTNGTEIIQSVFTSVDGNGKIYFAPGIYDILGLHITLTYAVTDSTQQYLEIYGAGMGETIFRGDTSSAGYPSTNATETDQAAWFFVDSYDLSGIRVYFHDFQIYGQRASQANIVSGLVLMHPRDSLVERIMVLNCSRNGISVVGANLAYRATEIRSCKIFDINDPDGTPSTPYTTYCNGINMEYGFADLYVYDNQIGWIGYVNDAVDPVGNGICISDSDIAERNTIWVVGRGIVTWWDVLDILIQDNWIDFAFDAGIHIDHANMTTCLNNVIRCPDEYGIYISNSSRCMVQNNKLLLRAGFSCVSFIWEAASSDCNYNSISFNNAWNQGTISVECIHLSGANSTADHNVGDTP